MNYSEHTYQLSEVKLHVVEAGPDQAPVLLFLHGFPEYWYGWRRQAEYFSQAGWRVVMPDQRGYHLSDKPKGVNSYAVYKLAKDIVELTAVLGQEKIHLVGHDWGALVAWHVAEYFPQTLHKLVIINVPHPDVMKHTLLHNFRQVLKSWYAGFFQIPWLPERILAAQYYQALEQSLLKSSLEGTFSPEDIEKYKVAWRQSGALTAMINWYRAALQVPKPPFRDQKIEVPTLLIWGAKDQFLEKEMAPRSVERCEKGELRLLEDATHWIHLEKSTQVNAWIDEFIGR